MHKVKVMLDPPTCLICGRGNVVDSPDVEEDFWAIDTERDVNWGDNAYICKYCCEKVGELAGYVGVEQVEELERTVAKKNKEIHDLESRLELKERRLTTMIEGHNAKVAEKKERKAKPKTKKKAAA